MRTRLSAVPALLCGVILASGCTETVTPDVASPDDVQQAHRSSREQPLTVTAVALDAPLADLCAVRSSFEVDPTTAESSDDTWISALASCITSGPLQGRSLELVAHTATHHDNSYARRVGETRADSLRSLLIENGVPQDEVRSSAAVAGDERSVEVRIAARHVR